ncbi:FAD/NAD(P)-binding domain-containing protein [Stipitochalara longipes BDJ]|nr:FAD/NAD(P)-binding domain-containing protein [Stipitochalara longipes BDJ]
MAPSTSLSADPVDVVIVGAGLIGFSCIILEVRDRVGGKTLSQPLASGKGVVDLGAAWLNEVTQPRIYALAKKYGYETVRVAQDQLPDLPPTTLQAIGMITSILETEAAKLDLRDLPISPYDKITVSDFLKQKGADADAYTYFETTVKGLLGVDATELSLFFYLDYIKSGGSLAELMSERIDGVQYQRLREGMQSISKGMARDLQPGSLFLQSPVSQIQHGNSSTCTVITQKGQRFCAKKIIISIPTPLCRTIKFSPALPNAKMTLADSTTLGYYAKTVLIYKKPWWREIGLRGSFISLTGVVSFSYDTSVEADSQYSITLFHRRRHRTQMIAAMVGEEHGYQVYQTEEIIEDEWIKEQWSQGAPSPVMGPNLLNKYADVLRAPCGNLHFVGTETAYQWKGYMDGAISAGKRGAREVISA